MDHSICFSDVYSVLDNFLGDHAIMILATAERNRVTARPVNCIINSYRFFFQTDIRSVKCRQIVANPLVALCNDSLQIEGVAKVIGAPSLPEHAGLVECYRSHYPNAFAKYSHLPFEVLISVDSVLVKVWRETDGKPGIDIFDIVNQTVRRELAT